MNEELFHLFCEINPESHIALNHAFKKSPKMLRLIYFLKTINATFKTPKAINVVYKEEIDTTNYSTLINRFYKLRQQLIEWLYHYLKKTEDFSSKEEQNLNFIRYLADQNQFKDALDKALKLEKHCKELNLFELLPRIMNTIIYCRQCILYDNDSFVLEDEARLLKAINWHQVLQKLQYYYQVAHRAKKLDEYKKVLLSVRKLIAPYKEFPRFLLIYHYLAFSKGVVLLGNKKQSTNALVRHLNKIEGILDQHPKMPIVFARAHYVPLTTSTLFLLKAIFYFQRGQFSKATQMLKSRDQIITTNPTISFPASEPEIHNMITMLVGDKQYDAALKKWEELIVFHKKHEQNDRTGFVLIQKVNIFFFRFPRGTVKEYNDLLIDLQEAELDENYITYINVAIIWMKLLLAIKIQWEDFLQEETIFQQYGLNINLIYRISEVITTRNVEQKQALIQDLEDKINSKKNSTQVLYYQQFILLIRYYVK